MNKKGRIKRFKSIRINSLLAVQCVLLRPVRRFAAFILLLVIVYPVDVLFGGSLSSNVVVTSFKFEFLSFDLLHRLYDMLWKTAFNHGEEAAFLNVGLVLISALCLADYVIVLVGILGALTVPLN